MVTSVVVTTYNGAKHIVELLDSLKNQTRHIDEVLIFDDVSNDNTKAIIEHYIRKNQLNNWTLTCNEVNLGWEKNFKNGLMAAKGDLIFPCDQDDIWHTDKVEKMAAEFEKQEDIWLLVSGYHAFSDDGAIVIKNQNLETKTYGLVKQICLNEHYYDTGRPGCTMCIRRNLLELFEDAWKEGMAHDAVLWSIACLKKHLYLYDEELIEFRRHNSNTSNSMYHNVDYKLKDLKRIMSVNNWYLTTFEDNRALIKNCTKWCNYRYKLIHDKKLISWFKLYNYRKYYLSIRKYLGDLYYFLARG